MATRQERDDDEMLTKRRRLAERNGESTSNFDPSSPSTTTALTTTAGSDDDDDEKALPPPAAAAPSSFGALTFGAINGDCLIHILSFLPPADMNSVAVSSQDCRRARNHDSLDQTRSGTIVFSKQHVRRHQPHAASYSDAGSGSEQPSLYKALLKADKALDANANYTGLTIRVDGSTTLPQHNTSWLSLPPSQPVLRRIQYLELLGQPKRSNNDIDDNDNEHLTKQDSASQPVQNEPSGPSINDSHSNGDDNSNEHLIKEGSASQSVQNELLRLSNNNDSNGTDNSNEHLAEEGAGTSSGLVPNELSGPSINNSGSDDCNSNGRLMVEEEEEDNGSGRCNSNSSAANDSYLELRCRRPVEQLTPPSQPPAKVRRGRSIISMILRAVTSRNSSSSSNSSSYGKDAEEGSMGAAVAVEADDADDRSTGTSNEDEEKDDHRSTGTSNEDEEEEEHDDVRVSTDANVNRNTVKSKKAAAVPRRDDTFSCPLFCLHRQYFPNVQELSTCGLFFHGFSLPTLLNSRPNLTRVSLTDCCITDMHMRSFQYVSDLVLDHCTFVFGRYRNETYQDAVLSRGLIAVDDDDNDDDDVSLSLIVEEVFNDNNNEQGQRQRQQNHDRVLPVLQNHPNLERLVMKNGCSWKIVFSDRTIHARVAEPFLVKTVRRLQSLRRLETNMLSQENVVILRRERPEITFVS